MNTQRHCSLHARTCVSFSPKSGNCRRQRRSEQRRVSASWPPAQLTPPYPDLGHGHWTQKGKEPDPGQQQVSEHQGVNRGFGLCTESCLLPAVGCSQRRSKVSGSSVPPVRGPRAPHADDPAALPARTPRVWLDPGAPRWPTTGSRPRAPRPPGRAPRGTPVPAGSVFPSPGPARPGPGPRPRPRPARLHGPPRGCGPARRGGAAEGAARDAPKGTAEGRGRCRKPGRGAARDALKGERRGGGDECVCGHRGLRAVPLGHPGHLCLQPPGGPARFLDDCRGCCPNLAPGRPAGSCPRQKKTTPGPPVLCVCSFRIHQRGEPHHRTGTGWNH
ncbi:transmembrane 6 superfamily member 1 isoform X4 [Vulpes lagopus]|uniref:transmembrane 6 superfamily member 1 isoform X4 n=1 Tax=Vulpes lagopus TaxID=494514 RepID=UPI001BC9E61C|nr:transmembrane 6 superfamily member 1 isoform X4 [Vulpes lagopus]